MIFSFFENAFVDRFLLIKKLFHYKKFAFNFSTRILANLFSKLFGLITLPIIAREPGSIKGEIFEFVTNHGSYIACSSVMFSMEKIKKVGFFDEDTIATDELYWPKVLAQYPIAVLGEILIDRRSHKDQTEYGDFIKYEKDAV